MNVKTSIILGIFIALGLFSLGYTLGNDIVKFKLLDRTVKVKGLSQKEVKANIVIWPIGYIRASNNLTEIYENLEKDTKMIYTFLETQGFSKDEITLSAPVVTDKMAQSYDNNQNIKFRYSASSVLTIYTKNIDLARQSMTQITKLGKKGISFQNNSYENRTEYMFTKLNTIKPEMIQEATKNARTSAKKFAEDSQSKLGKIKKANQGQFTINQRDKNTPYIKRVRVVSTVEYYLSD